MSTIWKPKSALDKVRRGQRIAFHLASQPQLRDHTAHGIVTITKHNRLVWVKTDRIQGRFIKPVDLCIHRSQIDRMAS